MNDLETTVVITPAIPLCDMTPLECLVLSHVFDAGPTDEGLLLYSDRGAASRLRFRADELVDAYAASRHVAHSDINRIAARCWTLWCEEEEPGETIEMDLTETSFEFMLRNIVARSSVLSEIRVLEWYRHPSQNPDSFGVKIMLVSAVAIVGRSSDDLLEELRTEAETLRVRRSSGGPPVAKNAPAVHLVLDQAERFIAGSRAISFGRASISCSPISAPPCRAAAIVRSSTIPTTSLVTSWASLSALATRWPTAGSSMRNRTPEAGRHGNMRRRSWK